MNDSSQTRRQAPYWARPIFIWPTVILVAIIITGLLIIYISRRAVVIIENETGRPFREMKVVVCNQTHVFNAVEGNASVEMSLNKNGETSDVIIYTNGCDLPMWRGGMILANPGHRLVIRLDRDNLVDVMPQVSWIHRLLIGSDPFND